MSDPEFVPINEDHAIQTVVFAVSVNRALQGSTIDAVRKNHDKWKDDLPAIQTQESIQIEFGPKGAVPKPSTPGVMFSFVRPDGTPAWVFRVAGAEIAVECTRYTRFEKVWKSAYRYLKAGLEIVAAAEPDLTVTVTAMQVVDKFRATKERYDLRNLFKPNKYLAEALFGASPVWHNHIGWFQPLVGNNSLQRIDLDARRQDSQEDVTKRPIFIAATHLQQVRYSDSVVVGSYDTGADQRLDIAVCAMHEKNKEVLTTLLTDEILARIGLAGSLK